MTLLVFPSGMGRRVAGLRTSRCLYSVGGISNESWQAISLDFVPGPTCVGPAHGTGSGEIPMEAMEASSGSVTISESFIATKTEELADLLRRLIAVYK